MRASFVFAPFFAGLVLAAPAAARADECGVEVTGLAKATAEPGSVVEILGRFGEWQGEKQPVVNGQALEVVNWSPDRVTVRLSHAQPPGEYKVGVVCRSGAAPARAWALPTLRVASVVFRGDGAAPPAPAPARAPEAPDPCRMQLTALSVDEAEAGALVELYGSFGAAQGEKLVVANGRPLDVIFWSDPRVTVRLPVKMRPARYRVGVYCHPIRGAGTRSSGFLSLRVTVPPVPAPAPVPVAETAPQPPAAPELSTSAAAPATPAVAQAPAAVRDGSPAARSEAEPAEAPPPAPVVELPPIDAGDDPSLAMRWRVWLVPAGTLVLALLGGLVLAAARRKPPAETRAREAGSHATPGDYAGEHQGIAYVVASAGGAVVVAIDARGTLARPLVFDARGERPALPGDERAAAILGLLALGANYVDVGGAERVTARFPARGPRLPRRTAEQAVELLERLRWLSV